MRLGRTLARTTRGDGSREGYSGDHENPPQGLPHLAETTYMDRESESVRPVALRAERNGAVLSWDAHPLMAEALKLQLESEGWTVSISTEDGPRRRQRPRIDREGLPMGRRESA